MSAKFGFIIGTGRCGTSWLGQMLNSNAEICVPPETQILFEYSDNGDRLFEEFSLSNGIGVDGDRLAFIIERSCPHDLQRFFDYRDFCQREDTPRGSLEAFAPAFYSAIARYHRKSWLIEQTPWYGQRLDLILKFFPQAKIIHMVRDGRDVALSFSRTNWWSKSPQINLARWQREIKKITLDASSFIDAEYYLEVEYEDLVANTESELRKICDFLCVKFDKGMLDPANFIDYDQFCKSDPSEDWSHAYSVWRGQRDGAAFSDSVAAWRKSRDVFQTPLPQGISEWLTRYGYDLEGPSPTPECPPVRRADTPEQPNWSQAGESPSPKERRDDRGGDQPTASRTGSVNEGNERHRGAEMRKKEQVLVFPGLLRLLNDIGITEYDKDRVPSNFNAVRRLLVPVLKKKLRVNESEVLMLYPKIKYAFERGDIVNISEYVANEGYFDGVVSMKISFDEEFYLNKYEDVRVAVSSGEITAVQHWLLWGYREGRLPSASIAYMNVNKLLQ